MEIEIFNYLPFLRFRQDCFAHDELAHMSRQVPVLDSIYLLVTQIH